MSEELKVCPEFLKAGTFLVIGYGESWFTQSASGDRLLDVVCSDNFVGNQQREKWAENLYNEDNWIHDIDAGAIKWDSEVGETDHLEVVRIHTRATGQADIKSQLDSAKRLIEQAADALKASEIALDDWVVQYASDHCSPEAVDATWKRIWANGGTLAYTSDVGIKCTNTLAAIAEWKLSHETCKHGTPLRHACGPCYTEDADALRNEDIETEQRTRMAEANEWKRDQ